MNPDHQRSLRRVFDRSAGSARSGTFGAWLRRQTGRQDPVGDLARDYTAGCTCPACAGRVYRRYSVAGVRAELDDHNADPGAYEALERAAGEWRTSTRPPPAPRDIPGRRPNRGEQR